VVDLLEHASDRLDQIMIPKVGCAADIYAVDALVTAVEAAKGRKKRISLEVIIETAAGIAHVEEIAAASPRLQAMSLGAADFAASHGDADDRHRRDAGELLHAPRRPEVLARPLALGADRHRRGLPHPRRPAGGRPLRRFQTMRGFRAQARRSATLGMVGKWAIHPKQVALANEVFTPSEAAVAEAREILAAMEEAKRTGQGAAVYKGRLVDLASIRQAEVIVRQAEMIAG
jgi:malyl-CoA/(S)-citramalyl-CoA lyase